MPELKKAIAEEPKNRLNTAVLFLIFNRLDTTERVFEVIREVKPPRLYVAADGPRTSPDGEVDKVHAVRDYVMNGIDWGCEVRTLFREQNLGCRTAVSSAIDWFFENEDKGIILEDDCLPSKAFFEFCEKGLNQYQYDEKVFSVGGTNLLASSPNAKQCFSLHGTIWGWATWRRAWNHYDVNSVKLSIFDCLAYSNSLSELINTLKIRRYSQSPEYNSWDYQWLFTRIRSRGLTLMPKENLIINIGFEAGTHHQGEQKFEYPDLVDYHTYQEDTNIERDSSYDSSLWKYKNP
jgi:hypothetical protein